MNCNQGNCCEEAEMLKALGHPVRWKIVRHLHQNENCCCGDLCGCFDLSQSTVSQHLGVLKDAGLLEFEKCGNRSKFSLKREGLLALQKALAQLATPDLKETKIG